ncbi:hypothetical protein [Metabacillus fastidiosus]|nr:hypothetical protein [Metabacillus fastidiosus]
MRGKEITFTLDNKLYKEIEEKAESLGVTKEFYFNMILRKALKEVNE